MNEEQIFLASAYLDGELTDAERRLAESDPAVMAEVDELRALQGRLREVERPSAEGRESAIAAAMAEFRGVDTVAVAPEPAVVPYRPRPSYGRYLAIAAAVAAVGLMGVVIVNSSGGDDDDGAVDAPAEDAADEPAMEAADAGADAETSFAEESIEQFEEPAEERADEPAAGDFDPSPADAADDLAEADIAAAEPVDEAAADADDGGGIIPTDASRLAEIPGGTPESPIVTEDELLGYADEVIELTRFGLIPPSPESSCDLQVLTTAYLLFDDVVSEVFVAIDTLDTLDPPATTVWAIDPDTCDALLMATRTP